MNLDLNLFVPQTMYRRSGLECYLCQSRKKLIQKTPEEKVRQSLIRYLVEELKTPSDRISAEVPMSYYLNGASGRADIIVDDKKGKPVLLIECKEVNQIFLDDAIVQAKRYNKIVQANAIMVTNGQLCHYFLFDERNQTYKELSKIPSYKNLTKWKWFNFSSQKNNTILRPVFRSPIPQLQIDHYIQEGWVGEETNPLLY